MNPITCFSNPSSSRAKRYSCSVVREANRHGSLGLGKVTGQDELRGVNFKQLGVSHRSNSVVGTAAESDV